MISAIVTDIEGTTSSIRFVHDVLFPYARRNLPDFVRQHADEPAVHEQIQAVRQEIGSDVSLEEVIAQLVEWIDQDKKITSLKALQGLIWETGYKNGDFHGHIYQDACENLQKWHQQGIRLYVYSSGSVYAQKLLFAHTEFGDLTPLFSGYFDTRIGAKNETQSYTSIVLQLDQDAGEILFLSDVETELDAAAQAGMETMMLVREGDGISQAKHRQVTDFNQIHVNQMAQTT